MTKFLWKIVWRNARILESKGLNNPGAKPIMGGTYDVLMFIAQWTVKVRNAQVLYG